MDLKMCVRIAPGIHRRVAQLVEQIAYIDKVCRIVPCRDDLRAGLV